MVLEDGLTSSFNHDLQMTLEFSIEDVMLGKFIVPEQSKTKVNDFVMRVANKKRHLHSSQRLLWSLRTDWQVVSTTIFEWLLNLWLKMWMNYRVVAADNLLEGRTNRMIFFNHTQCFKTQSKLPSMMQAQIWATNVIWGGTTFKSLLPCLVSMPNTTICDN